MYAAIFEINFFFEPFKMEVIDVQISCEKLQEKSKKLPKLIPAIPIYPEHKRPQSHLATFQMTQPPCRSGKSLNNNVLNTKHLI